MTGRGFKLRMLGLALPANVLSVAVVAAYLTTLLDFARGVWVGFAWVVLGWFVVFQALAQKQQERLQGPVARWLDADAAGGASEEQTLAALAAAVDSPRRTLIMGYTLWPIGGLAVALTMKALFTAFHWNDVVVMIAAALSGGALSSLLLAFLFKRFMEPLRARLARAVLDPDARAAAAPRLPIAWKLQGTVLVTAVVPVLFAAFVAQRNAREPLLAYVHGLQETWLARAVDRLGESGDPALLGGTPGSEAVGSWALLDAGSGAALAGDRALARTTTDVRGDAATASGWAVVSGGVVSWRRLGEQDRILSVGLPAEALASASAGISFFLVALLLSALAVAIGVAWLVAQDLARSIAALREEADCIASGDLSRPQVFESEDELGELGRAFDRMRQALRETVGRVAQAADRVEAATTDMAAIGSTVAASAAEQERAVSHARQSTESVREQSAGITASAQELSASVEESSSSILEMGAAGEELNQTASVLSGKVDEVSTSIEQMIRGVAEMARNVEGLSDAATETESSVQEMAGSMREVNANAAETARLSAQVVTVAEGGRERVQETISGMEAIRDATDTVEQVIRGLGERAKEIGAIVDVIDDVADETNLLALNAAIIAAQAGEHGRAFSVVADEIKELADRVMSSTKEIGGLIRSVQSESAAAISAIERGSESVWAGVERSAQAGESLEAITRTARESGQRIGEIVQAVQEQARAAAHVQQLMERVRISVEQLRNATREQEQGNGIVLGGTATMREVAQQVHRTTEEQARGGNQIRAGIEVVRQAVERIYQALQDQAAADQQSAQSMGRVSTAARANHESAGQMERSTEDLRAAAGWLREEIRRFRL